MPDRVHIVLIPGFAGFDALGQLEYYAGTTRLFQDWKQGNPERRNVVLHYFDNFPTAAVSTRAERLRNFIAKRIARGEFMPEDRIALAGHSTGGLDIRRLLWDLAELAERPEEPLRVDGGDRTALTVDPAQMLKLIDRVVFLSVPQWGTNIADWVCSYDWGKDIVLAELRAAVFGSQLPVIDRLQSLAGGLACRLTKTQLLYAVEDALNEANPGGRDPARLAAEHEAAAQLGLWLRHMSSDFGAICDLKAKPPKGEPVSPAHFTVEMRNDEIDIWKRHGIETCSYATRSRSPFRFEPGSAASRFDLAKPWTYPELMKDGALSAGTDVVYRLCYRACAGGPFRYPPDPDFEPVAAYMESGERTFVELWDNDGIVNTASMLWPNGPETRLLEMDHMDIVGHYALVPAVAGSGRRYQAYDLVGSASECVPLIRRVWEDVFAFCSREAEAKKPRKAKAKRAAA